MRTSSEVQYKRIGEGLQCIVLAPSSFAFTYNILTTGDIVLQNRSHIEVSFQFEFGSRIDNRYITCFFEFEFDVMVTIFINILT